MDLIDRMAAIEEVDDIVASVSVCATVEQARGATWAKGRIRERLDKMPTVPAVPLDKLCEWLGERYEPPYSLIEIEKLKWPIDFRQQKEMWMVALTKWMEGLDGNK